MSYEHVAWCELPGLGAVHLPDDDLPLCGAGDQAPLVPHQVHAADRVGRCPPTPHHCREITRSKELENKAFPGFGGGGGTGVNDE